MAANGLPDEDAEAPPATCPRCERVKAEAAAMMIAATAVSDAEITRLGTELAIARAQLTAMVIAATAVSDAEITRLGTELAIARAQLTAFTTAPIELTKEQDQALEAYAAELKAKMAKTCLIVGKVYRHPLSNRLLKVTDGSFLGGYGRVCNFWHWDYLTEDFSPAGQTGQGYGWASKPVEEPQS